MLWLVLSIFTNGLIGVIFKIYGEKGINTYLAIAVNYFVCVITASIYLGEFAIPLDFFSKPWCYWALFLGLLFPLIFNLYALSIKHIGIVISTIFQKMSLIAPVIIGILWFREEITLLKSSGIMLAIAAIVLLPMKTGNDKDNNDNDTGNIKTYIWIAFLVFLGSAFIDTGLLFVEKLDGNTSGDIGFIATLFLIAGIISIPIFFIQKNRLQFTVKRKDFMAGIFLGVPNFFSIYFITKALSTGLDGSRFFPINNVGILLFSAVIGILWYKEEMNSYRYLGIGLSVFSIILLAL